jgi:glycosyltransferase involved in cell wall biosynthesis
MKILLLTDFPPCADTSGGLVLLQFARFMPPESLACFTILNRHLPMKPDPALDGMAYASVPKPNELNTTFLAEAWHRWVSARQLAREVERFARDQGVDRIWAVLEGQTLARVINHVADRLKLPLHTLVWDELSWWLRAHGVDRFHASEAQRSFDRAVRRSRVCGAASWPMAEEYARRYGTRCVAIPPGIDDFPRRPRHGGDEIVIGMAGQFYAIESWRAFLKAIRDAGGRIAGRPVRLRVLSREKPEGEGVEHLGWKGSQREVVELLSEADVLFCPHLFAPEMEGIARYSFPSKLITYFAAGRPVVFHGPTYASGARYIQAHNAGVVDSTPEGAGLIEAVEHALADEERLADRARAAFLRDFTLEASRRRFFDFLDLADSAAAGYHSPATHDNARAGQ